MINYIICLGSKEELHLYKKIIQNLMKNKKILFKIYYFSNLDEQSNRLISENICGKKIYILDSDNSSVDVLDYAKNIRVLGDFCSQVMVILDKKLHKNINLIEKRKIDLLDIIFKDDNFIDNFNMYLDVNLRILNNDKALCFKYNNELFHILYNDIYYIEKNLNNNDSTIVTKDKEYIINLSINKLMDFFNEDDRFFKSHRSCIVNLDNIIGFDISNNIIKFKDMELNLVSRNKKKELKNRLNKKFSVF